MTGALTFTYAYPICALLFLSIVMLKFFSRRQMPVLQNRLFTVAILLSCAYAVFEVCSAMVVRHGGTVPTVLSHMVLTIFYLMRLSFPILMILYTLSVTQSIKTRNLLQISLLVTPALLCAVVVLTNPVTGLFFKMEESAFRREILYPALHVVNVLSGLFCIGFAISRRARFSRTKFHVVAAFSILSCAGSCIELLRPAMNISSIAIAAAVLLTYLALPDQKSMVDHLTGLLNLDAMMDYTDELIAREVRYYVIVMKVENVRRINSIFGYTIGSLTLKSVAAFLSSFSPDGKGDARRLERKLPSAWAFRLMSNQFAVVCTDEKTHETLLTVLQKRFDDPWTIRGLELNLMLTTAEMKDTGSFTSGQDLYKVVEIILPSLPKGDTVTVSEKELEKISRHIRLEASLERALETGSLDIRFQPVLSTVSGRFSRAEALVRFFSEEWGDVPAEEIIPIAEKRGLGAQIDEFMIRKTCEWIKTAKDEEIDYVSVNISATDFISEAFPGKIVTIMKEYGVPYKKIVIEIPEPALKTSMMLMMQNLSLLSAMGFSFAMDNVKLGAIDMSQLAVLPISLLKLDRGVVEEVEASPRSRILFENTIDLLRKMEIASVVVGVESQASAQWVESCRPDMVQGFYYARPMDGESCLSFLRRMNAQSPRKPGRDNFIVVSDSDS